MDGTRTRRTRDAARQRWYGSCRTLRFARHMQFLPPDAGQLGGRNSLVGNQESGIRKHTRSLS